MWFFSQPWLEKQGLQNCTQMLAYFAVAKLGDPVTDGKTELNPEGLSSITGKWGEAVAQRLHAHDLSCHVLSKEEYVNPPPSPLLPAPSHSPETRENAKEAAK